MVRSVLAALLVTVPSTGRAAVAATPWMPEDWRRLERPIAYEEMQAFLDAVDGQGAVTVAVAGESRLGRSLYLVRIGDAGAVARRRILFYAQQHGDEVSGKDALLYLVRDLARRSERLPDGVELWILPMMNPDGAVAATRTNGAGVDLNRDHIGLEQPETRVLHEVARRARPHIAVDCHEFARDPESWLARGWEKWPAITMDGMDNPLLDPELVAIARRWVEESAAVEATAGHDFLRYTVGGVPPDEELRHSAPDLDCALNAIATYGGLSFIVEAAARRAPDLTDRDLGERVDAYLVLLRRFVEGGTRWTEDLAAIERARARPLPRWIPTNYLWVNPRGEELRFPVREKATGRRLEIPTANWMTEIAIKKSVATPLGYAVLPAAAGEIGALLERQGIPFEQLEAPHAVTAEACKLLRVETEFDETHSRFEGRQIVSRGTPARHELPAGALWVPLAGEAAVRAALLLEPTVLYGLYQIPRFRALAGPDGALPVLRVTAPEGPR